MTDIITISLISVAVILLVVLLILQRKSKNNVNSNDIDQNEVTELKLYLQKEYSMLREHMLKLFHESSSSNQKDLNIFKDYMMKNINDQMKNINEKVEARLGQGFDKTNKTFQDVIERLAKIDSAQKKIEDLSTEVVQLNNILTDKKSRGTFGEVQLTQILQSVMGDNRALYELQKKLSNNMKVDALLHAPKPLGDIAVDSKFPLENYQRMVDKKISNLERVSAEKEFKKDVKKHIDDIATKYIIRDETAEQAFMFIPAEAIFAEITAYHEDIITYSQKKNVWLVSPTTLISTLTTILTIVKNMERDKQTSIILTELRKLGDEFSRYSDRWAKLKRSIETVSNDVNSVNISSEKITKKFNYIQDTKFDDILEENIDSNSTLTSGE